MLEKWHCFYITAGGQSQSEHMADRKVSIWKYVQPQLGGQFPMTIEYFNKHYALTKLMTEAKYNSQLLAFEIGNIYNVGVQDKSVTTAFDDICTCQKLVQSIKTSNNKTLVQMLAVENRYSMAEYPVGYHFDVFKGGHHSLENNIFFALDLENNESNIVHGGGGEKHLFLHY